MDAATPPPTVLVPEVASDSGLTLPATRSALAAAVLRRACAAVVAAVGAGNAEACAVLLAPHDFQAAADAALPGLLSQLEAAGGVDAGAPPSIPTAGAPPQPPPAAPPLSASSVLHRVHLKYVQGGDGLGGGSSFPAAALAAAALAGGRAGGGSGGGRSSAHDALAFFASLHLALPPPPIVPLPPPNAHEAATGSGATDVISSEAAAVGLRAPLGPPRAWSLPVFVGVVDPVALAGGSIAVLARTLAAAGDAQQLAAAVARADAEAGRAGVASPFELCLALPRPLRAAVLAPADAGAEVAMGEGGAAGGGAAAAAPSRVFPQGQAVHALAGGSAGAAGPDGWRPADVALASLLWRAGAVVVRV